MMSKEATESTASAQLRGLLINSVPSIALILKIYREPSFQFFVEFLRRQVLTEGKLPQLVMALPLKPACKLVMLRSMEGFLYAFEHPEEDFNSWNLNSRRSRATGSTAHIVETVEQENIDVPQVIQMLKEVFESLPDEVPGKNVCAYNNLTRRFSTVVQQAIREAKARGVLAR